MSERFDPAKDLTIREKHGLSLSFGDEIFGDDEHLNIPSIREMNGVARYKVISIIARASRAFRLCIAIMPTMFTA
ncbi:MAG: BrnT family toxin [Hyphomonas sp.]|uniref:hypothetical protein n=1 Tax=Hyphomonas sp. TaxID=87 RepID=UPI001850403A|nr:hypothetical protein [Hyphomonas sp.]MBA3068189.1 BrnT family toxin [Hyphomonas sp.]MBU3919197.1 BrnT family toxin [Alphaproteobacteria bacterium]MBU4062111.1 BrnT family toxin [Alphaproteobacteria bacterium]MBU4165546.1 BrnT family toxin [Alphaproteobacteria bacterium]